LTTNNEAEYSWLSFRQRSALRSPKPVHSADPKSLSYSRLGRTWLCSSRVNCSSFSVSSVPGSRPGGYCLLQ
jgi:hypothetical protein